MTPVSEVVSKSGAELGAPGIEASIVSESAGETDDSFPPISVNVVVAL
jgi:hypothetical protein